MTFPGRSTIAFLSLILLAGCSKAATVDATGAPEALLREAAQRTAAASSFRIQIALALGATNFSGTAIYRAPDRARIVMGKGLEVTTTIVIGDDRYTSDPGKKDRYAKI